MRVLKILLIILLSPLQKALCFLMGAKSGVALIAKNTTRIYIELKKKYSHCFDSEKELLVTSGIIDALYYVNRGQIPLPAIAACAENAISGAEKGEEDVILRDFIIGLEFLMYQYDNRDIAKSGDVLKAVIGKSEEIHSVVKAQLKAGRVGPWISLQVRGYMGKRLEAGS